MGVLSKKQFAKIKQEKESKKAVAAVSEQKGSGPAATPAKTWLWTFLYPEAQEGGTHNFDVTVSIEGGPRSFSCVNNKVDTEDPKIAEYLIRNQYILFSKKEL